ncbi:2-keto-4-pentenoate hydratase [Alteriqipengyuania lutimaris]|uniref:2-keto-4-pentenoate hydratase n=1 Tax=Alteriqipengyuania lutimaris TaxID=1538146 RepID=A0A395LJN9_9SPHN|nr:2-keto-4-pentenoate hydratase [Alteriqipengyuania lutimaris]MBB3035038.1 2-keto-4-pentenoate hydratase [Alteriqipengyuania lutimaris]RDS75664.1 2-keto-4-pentenoate hydratase [Alteriqipengyuania lutimaris]
MNSVSGQIAYAFVDARRSWKSVLSYPGPPPADLASAYQIQDEAISIWQRQIGGWKVGKINPPASDELGANRLIGPVFEDTIQFENEDGNAFRIFDGGFAAVEAEFMLRLAPPGGPLPRDRQEAMDWVDEVRIGIEIASSPYARINADGPCVTVSDHGNNAGLLIGKRVDRAQWGMLGEIEVSLDIEGDEVGRATTATMLDGAFGAVSFLLRNLAERQIEPRAGWWVSSGAITGVHEIAPGGMATANFENIGSISVRVDAAPV